jgi:hypothetical protein
MAKKGTSTSTKVKTAAKAKSSPVSKGGSNGGGTASARILKAIASQNAMGIADADRSTVQGLAAMPNKKSFDTTLLNMKKNGLVTYDTSTVRLTEKGLEEVGPEAVAVPTDNTAMQDKLKEQIKQKKSREIFDILTDGKAYNRAELAAMMKLEDNKSFGTYVSALSKVIEREAGKIRLKDIAFPCGRPSNAGDI